MYFVLVLLKILKNTGNFSLQFFLKKILKIKKKITKFFSKKNFFKILIFFKNYLLI